MRILLTSASSRLSRELAAALGRRHELCLTDRSWVETPHEFVLSELGPDASIGELVKDMEAIVHPGYSGETDSIIAIQEQLDAATRCTYNLLRAARAEGVHRIVYLSSLRLMDKYGEDLAVTERWLPLPTTDTELLCRHLGEFICREFAREQGITVICLRLGELVPGESDPAIVPSSALFPHDLACAVGAALELRGEDRRTTAPDTWKIYHVQSSLPHQRYLTMAAQERLGFRPAGH